MLALVTSCPQAFLAHLAWTRAWELVSGTVPGGWGRCFPLGGGQAWLWFPGSLARAWAARLSAPPLSSYSRSGGRAPLGPRLGGREPALSAQCEATRQGLWGPLATQESVHTGSALPFITCAPSCSLCDRRAGTTPGTMAVIGTGRKGCPGRCVALAMSGGPGPSRGGSLCPASWPRASLKWEPQAHLCSGCLVSHQLP